MLTVTKNPRLHYGIIGLKNRYGISRCYSRYTYSDGLNFNMPVFNGCLADLTESSKLIIIGHGDGIKMEGMVCHQLIDYLVDVTGLRTVGLISFKACCLGGSFLNDFLFYADDRDLKVGWLVGYKDEIFWSKSRASMIVGDPITKKAPVNIEKAPARVLKGNIDVHPLKPSIRFGFTDL